MEPTNKKTYGVNTTRMLYRKGYLSPDMQRKKRIEDDYQKKNDATLKYFGSVFVVLSFVVCIVAIIMLFGVSVDAKLIISIIIVYFIDIVPWIILLEINDQRYKHRCDN